MTVLLASVLIVGIVLPHRLRLERSLPVAAATLWIVSLALRGLTATSIVLYLAFYLPGTALFSGLTHWCWHTVLPLLTAHLGLDGHRVGDAATLFPGLVFMVSLLSVAVGLLRAARLVRGMLARNSLGPGPRDSVILPGPDVMLAAAGLVRPRVVVSAGALVALDDEELAAGLDHEHGHIARRHRFLLVFAELCRGIGRIVPGSRTALQELAFHLERDADRWAVRRMNDPHALASAICKAGGGSSLVGVVAESLSGSRARERLGQLIGDDPPRRRRTSPWLLNSLAATMVCCTLAMAALVPSNALAGAQRLGHTELVRHCTV